ncbi:YveK family protein [Niallia sp. Sow4_A1]|uniref:YveK family protein n=1 Tax=Niallia sp. Sow4_A1 TaxID=3438793 RepID=UPI003F994732
MEGIKSVKEIISVLKKRLLLIIFVSIGTGAISGFFTYYTVAPKYQTSSDLLVAKVGDVEGVGDLDIRTNMDLIDTYVRLIGNPVILNEVIKELNLSMSSGQLSGHINVANQDSTQILTITTTDTDPERAALITNTVANVFLEKLPELMQINNVKILNEATVNSSPISPDIAVNIGIAVALGAIIGIGLVLLIEFLDTTVRTKTDIERINIKVIGTLSNISDKDRLPQSFMDSLKSDRRQLNVTSTKTEF